MKLDTIGAVTLILVFLAWLIFGAIFCFERDPPKLKRPNVLPLRSGASPCKGSVSCSSAPFTAHIGGRSLLHLLASWSWPLPPLSLPTQVAFSAFRLCARSESSGPTRLASLRDTN